MYTFRRATPQDAARVAALVNAAYRGIGSAPGWSHEAHLLPGPRTTQEEIGARLLAAESRFELAVDERGEVVGCVHLEWEGDGSCYLGLLSVDPARQAKGLGGALLARAEEVARSWGCHEVRMVVIERRTELVRYYERRGYERTGRRRPFPEPGVDLPFVELAKRLGPSVAPP